MNLFLLNFIIIGAVGISIVGDIFAKSGVLSKRTSFSLIALILYTISSVVWLFLLRHVRLSVAVTWWQSVAIILTILVGIFYFRERVTMIEIFAMALIVGGIFLLSFQHA